jgi:hypothetical protein
MPAWATAVAGLLFAWDVSCAAAAEPSITKIASASLIFIIQSLLLSAAASCRRIWFCPQTFQTPRFICHADHKKQAKQGFQGTHTLQQSTLKEKRFSEALGSIEEGQDAPDHVGGWSLI